MRFCAHFALAFCLLTGLARAQDPAAGSLLPEVPPRSGWDLALPACFLESLGKSRQPFDLEAEDVRRTPNQERYDVFFYDLELDLDVASQILSGVVTIAAEVLEGPLESMDLNLVDSLPVTEVTCGGEAVPFTRAEGLLIVALDRAYEGGEQMRVRVAYGGDPAGDAFGWDTLEGEPLIWTKSEPYGAREWWPCKDFNSDKADSVALHVTVDEGLIVASNGLLVAETIPEPGKKTFHWHTHYPMATYLVSLAIHPYTVFSDEYTALDGVTTMPVVHYVVPFYTGFAQDCFDPTVEIMEAFSEAFGEYPFIEEKYGHAHFSAQSAGMEHQTLSSMLYYYCSGGLVEHELAHQWWGDMITCADFGHIWLNEGFATWCEAYWREISEGSAAYREEMENNAYYGGGTIFVEDPSSHAAIFDYYLSYQKASWVVHMLRGVLGDEHFFAGLRRYREIYLFRSATTEDFQEVMEEVSGQDLEYFFHEWIYDYGYPRYRVNWSAEPGPDGTVVQLRLEQLQTWQLFSMPLVVRLQSMFGSWDFRVENSERVQHYRFTVPGAPTNLILDPNHWVLSTIQYDGASDVPAASQGAPRLLNNVPNPFNPSTEVRFELPVPTRVTVSVYDITGHLVATLLQGEMRGAGQHGVRWDGRDDSGHRQASGTYFAALRTAGKQEYRKITLVQ